MLLQREGEREGGPATQPSGRRRQLSWELEGREAQEPILSYTLRHPGLQKGGAGQSSSTGRKGSPLPGAGEGCTATK